MSDWQISFLSVALTYLVHSTIFLVGCWMLLRCRAAIASRQSHVLQHLAWKAAAIGGVVTTIVHFSIGLGPTIGWSTIASAGSFSNDTVAMDARDNVTGRGSTSLGSAAHGFNESAAHNGFRQSGDNTSDEIQLPVGFSHFLSTEYGPVSIDVQTPNDLSLEPVEATIPSASSKLHTESAEKNATSDQAAFKLAAVALIAWLGISLLRMLAQSIWFQHRQTKYEYIDSGVERELLDELRDRLGINRRIKLMRASSCETPAAFGWLTWTIVLPDGVAADITRDELRALMTHEIAHLKRGDVWWLAIGRILCGPLAIQPLNFFARSRWQQASEFLCDRWAIDRGTPALTLAKCLTSLASRQTTSSNSPLVATALGNQNSLIDRVQHLVAEGNSRDPWQGVIPRLIGFTSVIAFMIFVTLFIPGGRPLALADQKVKPDSGWEIEISGYHYYEDVTWDNVDEGLRDLTKDLERLLALSERSDQRSKMEPAIAKIRKSLSSLNARREKLNQSDF